MKNEERPETAEEQKVPGWVYLILLVFLFVVLLGVESVLNWIWPGR